ncbi:cytochrome b-c1 complex subunit 7-like [Chelonus insularis]|uniref:cytochrome b-c1 complex subunit 7-like n=1 Tax=Chelonus insularis TaxID=460826 RepID=UPI00158F17C3|nr:cytochrome b-c1 complex subunit 7-like [Chelonus insularis]
MANVIKKNFLMPQGFKKWYFNLSRYNQLGLRHDDILYENEIVSEAVRRLPAHVYDERTFRIVRAMQLSCNKTILPKEQWTTMEEDVRYLQPYIDEIKKEIQEKEEWERSP